MKTYLLLLILTLVSSQINFDTKRVDSAELPHSSQYVYPGSDRSNQKLKQINLSNGIYAISNSVSIASQDPICYIYFFNSNDEIIYTYSISNCSIIHISNTDKHNELYLQTLDYGKFILPDGTESRPQVNNPNSGKTDPEVVTYNQLIYQPVSNKILYFQRTTVEYAFLYTIDLNEQNLSMIKGGALAKGIPFIEFSYFWEPAMYPDGRVAILCDVNEDKTFIDIVDINGNLTEPVLLNYDKYLIQQSMAITSDNKLALIGSDDFTKEITLTIFNQDFSINCDQVLSNAKVVSPVDYIHMVSYQDKLLMVLQDYNKPNDQLFVQVQTINNNNTCDPSPTRKYLGYGEEFRAVYSKLFYNESTKAVQYHVLANQKKNKNLFTSFIIKDNLTCTQGFNYLTQNCASECQDNEFLSAQFECQSCLDKCQKCQDNKSCDQPQNQHYFSQQEFKVLPCMEGCDSCKNGDSCDQCQEGFELKNQKCEKKEKEQEKEKQIIENYQKNKKSFCSKNKAGCISIIVFSIMFGMIFCCIGAVIFMRKKKEKENKVTPLNQQQQQKQQNSERKTSIGLDSETQKQNTENNLIQPSSREQLTAQVTSHQIEVISKNGSSNDQNSEREQAKELDLEKQSQL